MTPKDFMRSITPGEIQPSNLGLDMYRDIPSSKLLDVSIILNWVYRVRIRKYWSLIGCRLVNSIWPK